MQEEPLTTMITEASWLRMPDDTVKYLRVPHRSRDAGSGWQAGVHRSGSGCNATPIIGRGALSKARHELAHVSGG